MSCLLAAGQIGKEGFDLFEHATTPRAAARAYDFGRRTPVGASIALSASAVNGDYH
jgi:hypothetical protein